MHNSILLKSDKYSRYEICAISVLFFSDAFIISGKYSFAGTLEWLSIALSALLSIPIVLLYYSLTRKRTAGKLIKSIIILISTINIIISLFIFSGFVAACVLPELNPLFIPAGIFLLSAYSASRRFNTLSKSIHIIIPIIALFLICSLLLLLSRFQLQNITYPSDTSYTDMIKSIIICTMIFSVKGVLLLYLFKYEKSRCRDYLIVSCSLIIYGAVMTLILLVTLAVLGPGLYLSLDFPLYYPLGLTQHGYYFERAEVLSLIIFMITLTFKTGIYMRIIKMSLTCGSDDKRGKK